MSHQEETHQGKGADVFSVLLIEDHDFQREYVSQQLRSDLGARVDSASNGAQALEMLQLKQYDLVVCDLAMPAMDGIVFIKRLGELNKKNNLIVLSSQPSALMQLVERLARSLGFDNVRTLSKPFVLADFSSAIKEFGVRAASEMVVADAEVQLNDVSVDILEGLIRKQFIPWYQPQYDTRTGEIVGAEVLARWDHPTRGMLPPSAFIDTIIKSNWVNELNTVLLERALRAQASWRQRGVDLTISFNIPVSLLAQDSLPDQLLNIVKGCGGNPAALMLELTETTITDRFSDYLAGAARLKLQGFKLSIDDYGTGYSSLLNLMSVPFDEIKLDRVFVHGAHKNPVAQAALESSISLAHRLNIKIIAEGVENPLDLAVLQGLGCHTVQGFLLARPVAEPEMEALIFGKVT